jgi:hypothetical protein
VINATFISNRHILTAFKPVWDLASIFDIGKEIGKIEYVVFRAASPNHIKSHSCGIP